MKELDIDLVLVLVPHHKSLAICTYIFNPHCGAALQFHFVNALGPHLTSDTKKLKRSAILLYLIQHRMSTLPSFPLISFVCIVPPISQTTVHAHSFFLLCYKKFSSRIYLTNSTTPPSFYQSPLQSFDSGGKEKILILN